MFREQERFQRAYKITHFLVQKLLTALSNPNAEAHYRVTIYARHTLNRTNTGAFG